MVGHYALAHLHKIGVARQADRDRHAKQSAAMPTTTAKTCPSNSCAEAATVTFFAMEPTCTLSHSARPAKTPD
jgi:hypothetical protein